MDYIMIELVEIGLGGLTWMSLAQEGTAGELL
jgi:hypothetical protein